LPARTPAGMSSREPSGLEPEAVVSSSRRPERAWLVSCHANASVRSPAQDTVLALPLAEAQVRVAPVARVVTLIRLVTGPVGRFCQATASLLASAVSAMP